MIIRTEAALPPRTQRRLLLLSPKNRIVFRWPFDVDIEVVVCLHCKSATTKLITTPGFGAASSKRRIASLKPLVLTYTFRMMPLAMAPRLRTSTSMQAPLHWSALQTWRPKRSCHRTGAGVQWRNLILQSGSHLWAHLHQVGLRSAPGAQTWSMPGIHIEMTRAGLVSDKRATPYSAIIFRSSVCSRGALVHQSHIRDSICVEQLIGMTSFMMM